MDDLYLLISNPPHGEVDAAEAARLFGCTAAEARITINRPVAEVWLAGSADDLCGPAAALTALGARASLVPVRTLAALSKRPLLARFAFEPHGLRCEEPTGACTVVPYAGSVTAVVCRPAATERIVRLTDGVIEP